LFLSADVFTALLEQGIVPDVVTDQTSAHDELNGYVPNGMDLAAALQLRKSDPEEYKLKVSSYNASGGC